MRYSNGDSICRKLKFTQGNTWNLDEDLQGLNFYCYKTHKDENCNLYSCETGVRTLLPFVTMCDGCEHYKPQVER